MAVAVRQLNLNVRPVRSSFERFNGRRVCLCILRTYDTLDGFADFEKRF
jgi:hypothetical protein